MRPRVHEELDQHLFRYRRLVAIALQDAASLDLVQHLERITALDGQHPETDISQRFGENAAEAKHDHGTELGVVQEADDDLGPLAHHLLDLHALDDGVWVGSAHRRDDLLEPRPDLRGGGNVEQHPAGVCLVQHVGRDDLHYNRIADVGCDLGGLIRVACDPFVGSLETVFAVHASCLSLARNADAYGGAGYSAAPAVSCKSTASGSPDTRARPMLSKWANIAS